MFKYPGTQVSNYAIGEGPSALWEDVATYVEKVAFDYPKEGDNFYIYRPDYPNGKGFKDKLDLLLEYGLISQEEYNAVFALALIFLIKRKKKRK